MNEKNRLIEWMRAQKLVTPFFFIDSWARLKQISEHLHSSPLNVLEAYEMVFVKENLEDD